MAYQRQKVWLDCDPGHDDAIAILLALHEPELELLGISTVHGNGSWYHTTVNACRLLCSFGSPAQVEHIGVHAGASKPLMRTVRHDAEIHGEDALAGVEGLVSPDDPQVKAKLEAALASKAVLALAKCVASLANDESLTIVATGSMTNIAIFLSLYPEMVTDTGKIKQIVVMGGAEGRGNRSPVAEFNILTDPEAAAIVFNAPLPVVMVPLNVTHTALFTPDHDLALIQATQDSLHSTGAATQLRHTLSTLLSFFAATYKQVFGFDRGPPVHDPLCIAYLSRPGLFKGRRYNVQVETSSSLTAGATVIDLWNYKNIATPASVKEGWGPDGLNVFVCEQVDVDAFWRMFLVAVEAADRVSRLNGRSAW